MFHVGQRVVCIDASPDRYGNVSGLSEGHVYTISSIVHDADLTGVTLCEVAIPHRHKIGWYERRFRAQTEKKTDISIFTEMLKPKQRELTSND